MQSQHDSFRPVIRKTIREINPKKIRDDFLRCMDKADFQCASANGNPKNGALVVVGSGGKLVEQPAAVKAKLKRPQFSDAQLLVEKVLSEETPTFELDLARAGGVFSSLAEFVHVDNRQSWREIAAKVGWALSERGYTNEDALTPFERALGRDVLLRFKEMQKHISTGVLTGALSVGQADVARQLKIFDQGVGLFFGLGGKKHELVIFTLDCLDSEGRPATLPLAVDANLLGEALKNYPSGRAFIECAIPGARLDAAAVNSYIAERKGSMGPVEGIFDRTN